MTREERIDAAIRKAEEMTFTWNDHDGENWQCAFFVDKWCKPGLIDLVFNNLTKDADVWVTPEALRRALANVIILEGIIAGGSTSADLCIPNVEEIDLKLKEQVESFESTPEGKGWVKDEEN